jgi:6-pyruvoyl-tetrahydropterin synthase related domain
MNVAKQWKQGVVYPRWADLSYWGYGEPTFVFYPPASWMLGGFLGVLLPWRMVPGAFCWLALMLADIATYEVGKRYLSRSDALFAAIFYAVNPYFLLVIYWRSAFAELLAAPLVPLALAAVMRLEERGWRSVVWLSLIFAGAWLINLPAALMIHYSAAVLVLVQAVRMKSGRPLIKLAAAVAVGAGLASFYLVPAIYEQRWVQIAQVLSPGVRPQDNFLFTVTADPDHNHFNRLVSLVGISEICVLVLAIFLSRRARTRGTLWQLLSVWGVAVTFLLFPASSVLWEYLPKFRYVQLPFRWLLCVNVALTLLLAMCSAGVKVRLWIARGIVVAALVVVVLFAGKHTQPPWWDTAADIEEMRQFVFDGAGYEGVDEYLPTAADPDAVNKAMPQLSDEAGTEVRATVIAWRPTMKHFRLVTSEPIDLTVRLFNYPAWRAIVNGRPLEVKTSEAGLVVLPLTAGEHDVQIVFTRTLDRTLGIVVSCFSAAMLFAAGIWTGARRRAMLEAPAT